ncbi:alkylated DNA repair protein, putative [Theileria annulata]|uniref:Alkylated DNA repair protein, putative n=1 Tax=Theileria annulata TaxID=5874 RepID=Q4UFZ4_THEAN|nr:alkylated DNA repair protein, putative [Theileria annulata]CAI73995.1 alkylated DNA repair protein, putative [Theileria annulata]|eukprot:XP_954675.1 alkylated DNA repair protein, putative [Theileria annulata]
MYDNNHVNGLSNSVFLCIRNTPYTKLNTNSFRRTLLSIVDNYINYANADVDSDGNLTDSSDKSNIHILNAENYSVHFVLSTNLSENSEPCSLYGFEDFPGVFVLRNFLTQDQSLLLACETLRSYINPPNNSNLLLMDPNISSPIWPSNSFKNLRWSTIGHLYDWGKRQYIGFTQFPEIIAKIVNQINTLLSGFYQPFTADSAIINFYSNSYFLRLHRDDAEETNDPVINISLGAPAIFCICKEDPSQFPLSCVVDSGSIIIMSKNSRRCLHGISKLYHYVKPDSSNLNGFETVKDTKTPYANPYFIKNLPQCPNDVFHGFTTSLDEDQISDVKDYLSKSRISISVRKAKL